MKKSEWPDSANCAGCDRPLVRVGMPLCDIIVTQLTRTEKDYRCKSCARKRVTK